MYFKIRSGVLGLYGVQGVGLYKPQDPKAGYCLLSVTVADEKHNDPILDCSSMGAVPRSHIFRALDGARCPHQQDVALILKS